MLKAGVVLDSWKLPIFERRLKEAGYSWEQHPGVTDDTTLLQVSTNSITELHAVITAAQLEAAKSKKH